MIEPAWSRKAGKWFDGMIAQYARALEWVLGHQTLTLAVAVGTLLLTVVLYIVIPKGFFPVQDTGLIQVITEGPQSVSYEAMAGLQASGSPTPCSSDPETSMSLSSFHRARRKHQSRPSNTGRMLLNLQPRDGRKSNATEIIRRLQQATGNIAGATAYMQPVQDLTIDDRVSRTQYQFSPRERRTRRRWRTGPRA